MELKQPIVEPVVPKVRTFVTARNSDRSEGRGHTVFERYFDDVDEAIDAARRIDVQGMDGEVYEVVSVVPDNKVRVWGRWWLDEIKMCVYGFGPDTEWFDAKQFIYRVHRTGGYKEYLELKKKYGKYDPDLGESWQK